MKRSQTKARQVENYQSCIDSYSINNNKPNLSSKPTYKKLSLHAKRSSIQEVTQQKCKYQMKQKIGEGAFAQVRLAKQIENNKTVVIKTYSKMKLYDKERKKCVEQQINILKNIKHQNIITLLDSYQTEKTINIVMEHFSIVSLRNFMKQKNKISQQQLKSIITQIVNTLAYLHSQGIAHRDIKLQNILIDKKTLAIKLIDFGFAIHASGPSSRTSMIGTPCYLPPQMIATKEYDPFKADVWALGILFYFLCSGYFPFRSIDSKILQNKILKGQLLFPKQINPGCQYLITKMLRHNKQDRVTIKEIQQDSWIKPIDFSQKIALLRNKNTA